MSFMESDAPGSPLFMSAFFYRLACKQRVAGMDFEQKKAIAQQCSDYSLKEPIWLVHDEKYVLNAFPGEKFSGMQIYAYFEEIMSQFGAQVNADRTQMVNLFEKQTGGN